MQGGDQLHYLAGQVNIAGKFSDAEYLKPDVVLPHFISQIESMLATGELNPRHVQRVTLYYNDFTYEADTPGSYDYAHIAVYPTQR